MDFWKKPHFSDEPGAADNQSLSINITDNSDEDVVDKIGRVMRDEARENFRGVFSGTVLRFA